MNDRYEVQYKIGKTITTVECKNEEEALSLHKHWIEYKGTEWVKVWKVIYERVDIE